MKHIKIFVLLFLAVATASSCEKLFDPEDDNHSTEARLYKDPAFAEGLLLNAYIALGNAYALDEAATDDAVTNVKGHVYQRMATGEWSAQFDPMNMWNGAYRQIYYANFFLSIADKVEFAWDDRTSPADERSEMFRKRLTGEALGLRAWFSFELLKRHGGVSGGGTPLGFVIVRTTEKEGVSANLPRNTYAECLQFILDDIARALTLLPETYVNGADPAYNAVFGVQNKNRINGHILKALRARVLLHAASQPFMTGKTAWEQAADAAAEVLKLKNGLGALSATGVNFWRNLNDADILWRRDFQTINSWEVSNFPPSLFGNGELNPSQNLVDAFPMANGYPIKAAQSGYNPANPYAARDPRLKAYVLYHGNDLNGKVVNTNVEDLKNGLGQTVQSTRTGYYLKKLLVPTVNLDPKATSTAQHFFTLIRYTEMLLAYAEAANEAWGPTADPKGYGYTPVQILAAIRKRAGLAQPDAYLASQSATAASLRELIRNERRLELCFEGFRFYDMRRWSIPLTDSVKGMRIERGIYTVIPVEERNYRAHMQYGPVPYQELLKSPAMQQNKGW